MLIYGAGSYDTSLPSVYMEGKPLTNLDALLPTDDLLLSGLWG